MPLEAAGCAANDNNPCLRLPLAPRPTALSGNPAAYGAAADVRSVGSHQLSSLLAGYPGAQVRLGGAALAVL